MDDGCLEFDAFVVVKFGAAGSPSLTFKRRELATARRVGMDGAGSHVSFTLVRCDSWHTPVEISH